jgi:hypothetical protein
MEVFRELLTLHKEEIISFTMATLSKNTPQIWDSEIYTQKYPGPYKGMSSFIFGLGSIVANLCLTNSVRIYCIGDTLQKKDTESRGCGLS